MNQITFNDIKIDVIRKKIKTLRLSICHRTRKVRMAIPLRLSESEAQKFVLSKLNWIKKHISAWENKAPDPVLQYISGEHHYYQDNLYLLQVHYHEGAAKVILEQQTIHLHVREDWDVVKRKKIMQEWYRQQLKEQLPPLLEKWQRIIGVSISACGIKQMKTRWGTCNTRARRIWLNLELAKRSVECLEYIIAHELVHLLERNHNHRFHAYMDKFMPEWRMNKAALNARSLD